MSDVKGLLIRVVLPIVAMLIFVCAIGVAVDNKRKSDTLIEYVLQLQKERVAAESKTLERDIKEIIVQPTDQHQVVCFRKPDTSTVNHIAVKPTGDVTAIGSSSYLSSTVSNSLVLTTFAQPSTSAPPPLTCGTVEQWLSWVKQ